MYWLDGDNLLNHLSHLLHLIVLPVFVGKIHIALPVIFFKIMFTLADVIADPPKMYGVFNSGHVFGFKTLHAE